MHIHDIIQDSDHKIVRQIIDTLKRLRFMYIFPCMLLDVKLVRWKSFENFRRNVK